MSGLESASFAAQAIRQASTAMAMYKNMKSEIATLKKATKKERRTIAHAFGYKRFGVRKYRRGYARKQSAAQRRSVAIHGTGSSSMQPVSSRGLNVARPLRASTAIQTSLRQDYGKLDAYKVKHSEYLFDLPGSVEFAQTSLRVNPGDPTSFPWLSRIAQNYEKYVFKKLCFYLKTVTSTVTTGSVIMAFDYDASDAAPISKAAMLQYSGAVRSAPWANCKVVEDRKSVQGVSHYVSAAAGANDAEKRQQDEGVLYVATQGQASDALVSELWVEYEVELLTPQFSNKCSYWEGLIAAPFTPGAAVQKDINFLNPIMTIQDVSFDLQFNILIKVLLPGKYLLTGSAIADLHIPVGDEQLNVVPQFPSTTFGNTYFTGMSINNALAVEAYTFQVKFSAEAGDIISVQVGNVAPISLLGDLKLACSALDPSASING